MCPFVNDAACIYVTSCFDGPVQDEYGLALGLIVEGETVMEKILVAAAAVVVLLTFLLGMILLERATRLQVLEGGEFLQCEVPI